VLSTGLDSRSRLRVDDQPTDVEVTFVHEQSRDLGRRRSR
jgi:hypothetical protein